VTAIEIRVVEVGELYAGAFFFPFERAAEVLHAWSALLPGLPEELMSWASLLHFPPVPDVPAFARGRSFAVVMAALLGSETILRFRIVKPAIAHGRPSRRVTVPTAPLTSAGRTSISRRRRRAPGGPRWPLRGQPSRRDEIGAAVGPADHVSGSSTSSSASKSPSRAAARKASRT
jgi:hypothetical protein